MKRIVASILSLQQHLDALAQQPIVYRPLACPKCAYGKLWCHGCYGRKADRHSPVSASLNPIPIPRYLCLGCHRTCSRLPECLSPRRWYDWMMQQAVILLLLSGRSLRGCTRQCGLDRHTMRRWWQGLQARHQKFAYFLRARFPELGRAVDFADFWRQCLQTMSLSRTMAWLDRDGVLVP